MIKLKQILQEGKVLSVFDFDDTIAKSDAWVYVVRGGRIIKKLDPAEFAVYKPRPGETFDFREFDRKIRNPRLIKQNADLLRKQLDKARRAAKGSRKVTILTARRLGQPVTSFLKTMGIDAYVVPLGSADPQKKADWIEKQIKKGYDTVYFMDDSPKNISAVDSMLKRYPRVKSITKLIKEELLTEGKLGDCYPAGGRLIMNFFGDKEHKLVHGMVNGQGALEGMRYGHCWVESKNTVLDHSNGRKLEIPTQVYYALGRVDPKECKYYTPEEAAKFMVDEGHWGPWEMSGDTVMAEEIPDRKPEIGKQDVKINPKELDNIESKLTQEIPKFFYHATYKALLPSIKATGLDTREAALSWEDSKPGIVYLANDPGVAESYAEAAEEVSDEIYDSGIVILKVASKDLDLSKLKDDDNVQKDDSDTYEYHGQIPWSKLKMASLYEVDYHSKLSRGHKPDWYQLGTSDFKPFDENFADGKKPGRKGISKRVGIPKGATLTQLAKLAKAKGEKGRMARWQLNMRRGKKKKKS